uniref:Odorant receptor n=1 Tax=Lutzomyia longipalpis TaxID=7200 RepID=A0A7G3ALH4_LUTLO
MKESKQLRMFNQEKGFIDFELSATTFRVTSGSWRNRILIAILGAQAFIVPVFLVRHLREALKNGLDLNLLLTVLFSFGYVQIILKVICALLKRRYFVKLFAWIELLYREQEADADLALILEKHLVDSLNVWKLLLRCGVISLASAAIVICVKMRLDPKLGITMNIPYLPSNHGLQKELAYLLQLIFMLTTSAYIILIDLSIIFLGLQIMAALSILNDYIRILDGMIKKYPDYLQTILKRHCDVIQNIHWLNKTVKEMSLAQFLCSTFILLLMFLFVRKEQNQFAAYVLCFCGLIQIIALCLFGEFIRIKTERLSTALYLTMWYELSLKDQKIFLIILGMAQREYCLKAAGMYNINVYSFLQVSFLLYGFKKNLF